MLDLKTHQSREVAHAETLSWLEDAEGDPLTQVFPDGSKLRRTQMKSVTFPNSPYNAQVYMFTLTSAQGTVLLEFEAIDARRAGEGELVVLTAPLASGSTNLFIVNVNSGAAQFIATSRFQPPSMPVGANGDYVVWTEAYCGAGQGKTRLFDRRSRSITEIDASLWVTMTPGGLIGEGEFGPSALIDPQTLRYTVIIPPTAGQAGPALNVTWSPLFTYASRGQTGGHGGYCGG
jgi:hypothetical protein